MKDIFMFVKKHNFDSFARFIKESVEKGMNDRERHDLLVARGCFNGSPRTPNATELGGYIKNLVYQKSFPFVWQRWFESDPAAKLLWGPRREPAGQQIMLAPATDTSSATPAPAMSSTEKAAQWRGPTSANLVPPEALPIAAQGGAAGNANAKSLAESIADAAKAFAGKPPPVIEALTWGDGGPPIKLTRREPRKQPRRARRVKTHARRVLELARAQVAQTGAVNTTAIATEVGFCRSTISEFLRRHDGRTFQRSCTHRLANGKRCGAPIPSEAIGSLSVTTCALHCRVHARAENIIVPSALADAGVGVAAPVSPPVSNDGEPQRRGGRVCSICTREDRAAIDADLRGALTIRSIVSKYRLKQSSIMRHKQNHLREAATVRPSQFDRQFAESASATELVDAAPIVEVPADDTLLSRDEIRRLQVELAELKRKNDPRPAILWFLRANPGASMRTLRREVGGNALAVDAALRVLIEAKRVESKDGCRGSRALFVIDDPAQAVPPSGTAKPSIDPQTEIVRVDDVHGWPLAVVKTNDGREEALIEDEELGRRLGYADRPGYRMRELAFRHRANLGDVRCVIVFPPGGGKTFKRELYTEEQACFLAAKSETSKATELLKGMIAVFVAWRNGRLPASAPSIDLAAILAQQQAGLERILDKQAAQAERQTSIILQAVQAIARPSDLAQDLRPGESRESGDVRVSRLMDADGHMNQKQVAAMFGMPVQGDGANAVGEIARALGIFENENYGRFDVRESKQVGGNAIRHWQYGHGSIVVLRPHLSAWRRQFADNQARGDTRARAAQRASRDIIKKILADDDG